MMVKYTRVPFIFVLSILMLSCGIVGRSPKEVARSYLNAIKVMDIEAAIELSTVESREVLSLFKLGMEASTEEIKTLREEGSKLQVRMGEQERVGEGYKIWYEVLDASGLPQSDQNTGENYVMVIKEEGEWRVDHGTF